MPEQDQKSSPESPAVSVERASAMMRSGMSELARIASNQTEADAEAWALVETFDGRLTEAEKRIDRVLARLGVE